MDSELKQRIGRALGQITSGCFVMTASDGERSTGVLTSWVQQAAFEPPAVTVAVKRGRPIESLIEASGHFVLNTIPSDPSRMFKQFGKGFALDQEAFNGLNSQLESAGVVLEECLGHLACKVITRVDAGDHHVYVAEVINAATHSSDKPYVHSRSDGFRY